MPRYPLNLSDVTFQAFRAGGKGGQHQNKTSSAIRAIHVPTDTRAECRSERCQHKAKAAAIELLQAKLDRMLEDQASRRRDAEYQAKPDASYSSQARTYRMCGKGQGVVDHRTGHDDGNVRAVLAGHLDGFIRASMAGACR